MAAGAAVLIVAVGVGAAATALGRSPEDGLEGLSREERRVVSRVDVLLDRRSGRGIDRAIELLDELVRRHPDAAALHARLSYAHATLDQEWGRRGHLEPAEVHATLAAAAGKGASFASLAFGAARYGQGRSDLALAELEEAHATGGQGPFASILLANALRDEGRWAESDEILDEAFRRFPHSFELSYSMAWNGIFAHDFEAARGSLEHMKLLDPQHHLPRVILPMVALRETGSREGVGPVLRREAEVAGLGTVVLATRQMARLFGDRIAEVPDAFRLDRILVPRHRFNLHRGEAFWYAGRRDEAVAEYRAARDLLVAELEAGQEDVERVIMLAAAYAGLGQSDQAIRLVDRALELSPFDGAAPDALLLRVYAAEVLTRLGEEERALDLLEFMIEPPSPVTPALLRADPVWRPLDEHPRFQRLLSKEAP